MYVILFQIFNNKCQLKTDRLIEIISSKNNNFSNDSAQKIDWLVFFPRIQNHWFSVNCFIGETEPIPIPRPEQKYRKISIFIYRD